MRPRSPRPPQSSAPPGPVGHLLLWLVALAGGASPASAQRTGDAGQATATRQERFFDWTRLQFPPEEHRLRRAALLDALGAPSGVVLILSAHGLSHGETFRQNEDFLYLTGLELPGSALALDAATRSATLYAPVRDSRFESPGRPNDFPGRPLADDPEIAARSGISDVRPFGELDAALSGWEARGVAVHVNTGVRGPVPPVGTTLIPDWTPPLFSLLHLRTRYPALDIRNAYEAMARIRMVKSAREIEVMRRSAAATEASIRAAARAVGPGVSERRLEAAFGGACKENGAPRIAFASIIKSGPNSLWPWRVLASHYERRNRAMQGGELVIFDVGCEVDHYVSDIGRTFPVSGRFTPEQRRALEMEVGVADAIIDAVRPGVTLRELQAVADAAIPDSERRFMQTGLFFGHHIGLSTGDPFLADAPLEPGMVFTVEPWYYNREQGISVFTEDEILVTEGGAEVLTRDLPRDVEGLERLTGKNP